MDGAVVASGEVVDTGMDAAVSLLAGGIVEAASGDGAGDMHHTKRGDEMILGFCAIHIFQSIIHIPWDVFELSLEFLLGWFVYDKRRHELSKALNWRETIFSDHEGSFFYLQLLFPSLHRLYSCRCMVLLWLQHKEQRVYLRTALNPQSLGARSSSWEVFRNIEIPYYCPMRLRCPYIRSIRIVSAG